MDLDNDDSIFEAYERDHLKYTPTDKLIEIMYCIDYNNWMPIHIILDTNDIINTYYLNIKSENEEERRKNLWKLSNKIEQSLEESINEYYKRFLY